MAQKITSRTSKSTQLFNQPEIETSKATALACVEEVVTSNNDDIDQQPKIKIKTGSDTINEITNETSHVGEEEDINMIGAAERKRRYIIEEDIDFPEGGIKAYCVVLGSFMGFIPGFGVLNVLGVFESYISKNQLVSYPSSSIGWIFSIYGFITYTSCIFSGLYFDRNGSRVILSIGAALMFAGLMISASCVKYYQFLLALGILTAFGNGLIMSPLISVISHYFHRRRGLFSSVATLGGAIGGIVLPIMLRSLFLSLGFVWSIRILAFLTLFCLVVSIVLVKERFATKEGSAIVYVKVFDFKTLKEWPFLFNIFGAIFAEMTIYSATTYITSYAISKGFSSSQGILIITLINIGGIPGKIGAGYLADKFGRFNMMIIAVLATGTVNMCIWLPFGSNLTALYIFAVIYGVCSGSIYSMIPVCCGQTCKTQDFGKRYSTMYFFIAFGILGGVPCAGAIIGGGSAKNYDWFIVFTFAAAVLSAIFYAIARYCCVGWKIMQKF